MGIYRKYKWSFRGYSFWYEITWPDSMWDEVNNLTHDITHCRNYGYYIYNEPFEDCLEDFFADVIFTVEQYVTLSFNSDRLACLLAFVQHLNYYKEYEEYPRYPSETLMNKGGDCEDTAILMGFVCKMLGYDSAFIRFSGSGFLGLGKWGHVDLGVRPNFDGEFHGTYWTLDGIQYYFMHCNGTGWQIGDYSNQWGSKAHIYPTDEYYLDD